MAVPKRKTSTARRDKRRTHWKMEVPAMATCDHCGSVKRPHRVWCARFAATTMVSK